MRLLCPTTKESKVYFSYGLNLVSAVGAGAEVEAVAATGPVGIFSRGPARISTEKRSPPNSSLRRLFGKRLAWYRARTQKVADKPSKERPALLGR